MPEVPEHIKASQSWRDFERLQALRTIDLGPLGSVLAPETLTDLTQCLGLGSSLGVLAWRGHADSSWRIDSTLVRRLESMRWFLRGRTREELNARSAERAVINHARVVGHGLHEGPELSDLEILARLRHHGGATRLLDCTRNAYIAAWFAASDLPEATGAIIGFGERAPFFIDTREMVLRSIEDLLDEMGDRLGYWSPSWLSPRIAAQQAVFVFGQVTNHPWGSLPLTGDVLGKAGSVPNSLVVAVTPDLKAQLVDQLQVVHGLSVERLFPDLDGFASAHGASMPFGEELRVDWAVPDR
jgi:hypothetical protein